MAKFISILILLLWAAAAAAAVLLFKKKGKRAKLLCAGALILCIVLLAAYYFPEKGLIPADAEVSYTEMFSPLPTCPQNAMRRPCAPCSTIFPPCAPHLRRCSEGRAERFRGLRTIF